MVKKRSIFYIALCIMISIVSFKSFMFIKNNNFKGEEFLGIYSKNNGSLKERLIKIRGKDEFNKGYFQGIGISRINNEDVLILSEEDNNYKELGTYISEEIGTEDFTSLILTWNSKTPENTYVEVLARAYIVERDGRAGSWSEYLSWGIWGTSIKSSSKDSECEIAKIDTDVFVVKDKVNSVGKKIQIKVNLYSADLKSTPTLSQLTATFIDNNKSKEVLADNAEKIYYEKILETPCFSQYEREESIASRICSPTSLTMVLNRMGENLIVEDVAWNCYDYKYDGFGNWAFNVAFAGSLGYEAYIEYGSFESLQREISKGYPVVVSVKYTNDINNKEYPYIENSPLTTSGHLIVVCGIEVNNSGEVYIVVNDPAGKNNESVRRKYKLNEFLIAWSKSNNAMYVINKKY